jgi:hypothetical protein
MRMQWFARSCAWVLATCPACGANGHGKVTAVTLLLAEALQYGIAPVVPHILYRGTRPRAVVHLRRRAALAMGHLVRVHDSGFSKPDQQTHS